VDTVYFVTRMANQSQKKAAVAQASSAAFYKTFLVAINLLYLTLRLFVFRSLFGFGQMFAIAIVWGSQYYAYLGILNHAARPHTNKKELVGGKFLDLLAVVIVLQFGSLLAPKILLALVFLPIWGGWTLYSTFKGPSNPKEVKDGRGSAIEKEQTEQVEAKRKQRAERRRQKWS
jgi:hypothetical protein